MKRVSVVVAVVVVLLRGIASRPVDRERKEEDEGETLFS